MSTDATKNVSRTLVLSSKTVRDFNQAMYAFAKDNGWDVRVSSFIPRGGTPIPAWLVEAVSDPQSIVSLIEPGVVKSDDRDAHNYLFNTKRKTRDTELQRFVAEFSRFVEANMIKRFRELIGLEPRNDNPEIVGVVVGKESVTINVERGTINGKLICDLQAILRVNFEDINIHLFSNYVHALVVKNIRPEVAAEFKAKITQLR